jgi:hypothetical protein
MPVGDRLLPVPTWSPTAFIGRIADPDDQLWPDVMTNQFLRWEPEPRVLDCLVEE